MRLLYRATVGSQLYGFSTPESDKDYKGFGLPEVDELIGLKNWEQNVEKNAEENTEGSIYALRKYLALCLKGNPTILEVNFVSKEFTEFTTELGEEIRKFVRENLITKSVFGAYSAYFRAQLRKLQRPEREGKRQALIDKYGYDTKFSCHAYRLGIQAIELMRDGYLNPSLSKIPLMICKSIRAGELKKESTLELLTDLDKKMYVAYQASKLKEKPDFNKVNDFLVGIHLGYLQEGFHYEILST